MPGRELALIEFNFYLYIFTPSYTLSGSLGRPKESYFLNQPTFPKDGKRFHQK